MDITDKTKRVPLWSEYAYKCAYCGMECFSNTTPSGISKTKDGDYGSNATPTPAAYEVALCSASTTISFTAAAGSTPAYLLDSLGLFTAFQFRAGMSIRIATTSGTNDGSKTIATRGVQRGQILLVDTDSLTTESAATAGEVTIYHVRTQPNITTGCPLCGSLNSKGE